MKISILGAAGFLGRRVAARLAQQGRLGERPITGLTLFDLTAPPKPETAVPVTAIAGDIVDLPPAAIPPGHRRYLPPRRCGLGPGRGRLRSGTPRQPARHRRGGRCMSPAGRRREQTATGGVHVVRGEFLRRAGRGSRRRCAPGARQQLWRSESGGGTESGGCDAPWVPRRGVDPAAHRDRPPRPAQSRRQFILLSHRPRAAARAAGGSSGAGRLCRMDMQPQPRGRLAAARRRDGHDHDGSRSQRQSARRQHHDRTSAAGARRRKPGASKLVRRIEDKEIAAIVGLWPPAFEPIRARMLGFASHEPVVAVVRAFVEDDLEPTRL